MDGQHSVMDKSLESRTSLPRCALLLLITYMTSGKILSVSLFQFPC